MSDELRWLREKCESNIYRTAVLLGVWRELLAVAEAAEEDEDCHGPGGRMWAPGCACPACSQTPELVALYAAIRHHLDGAE